MMDKYNENETFCTMAPAGPFFIVFFLYFSIMKNQTSAGAKFEHSPQRSVHVTRVLA